MILDHELVAEEIEAAKELVGLADPLTFGQVTEWLAQGGQAWLMLGLMLSLVWHTAVCYTQFKHIRNNMVTKKDLQLAQLKLIADIKIWAEEKFVTERECATRISTLGPVHGGSQQK